MTKRQDATNVQEWQLTFQGSLAGTDAAQALQNVAELVGDPSTLTSGTVSRSVTYAHDTLNRLTGLAYTQGGTNLFTPYGWSYDALHRITQSTSQDGTSNFTHDATSQLTGADHSYQGDESYWHDLNGNRTNAGYQTGTNNRLTNDGTYTYEYDDEGNRTRRTHTATGAKTEYTWDHRNRLTRVVEKNAAGTILQQTD